jgi:hypothetical protein
MKLNDFDSLEALKIKSLMKRLKYKLFFIFEIEFASKDPNPKV